MIAAPALMPAQPFGAKPPSVGSLQLAGLISVAPTAQKNRITAILSTTMAVFELADSRMPITSTTVMQRTTRKAGRLAIKGKPRRCGPVVRAEARYKLEGSPAPDATASAAICADR